MGIVGIAVGSATVTLGGCAGLTLPSLALPAQTPATTASTQPNAAPAPAPANSKPTVPPPQPDAQRSSPDRIENAAAVDKAAPVSSFFGASPTLPLPPTEVYASVGRGALKCWFGAGGPLRATHIFHADAAPVSAGGEVDIVIHERDLQAPSPRGARAYRIQLSPDGGGSTRLVLQNNRIPADLAAAMDRDALAWAGDKESCEAQIVRPPPAPPPPEPSKPKKSKTARSNSK